MLEACGYFCINRVTRDTHCNCVHTGAWFSLQHAWIVSIETTEDCEDCLTRHCGEDCCCDFLSFSGANAEELL